MPESTSSGKLRKIVLWSSIATVLVIAGFGLRAYQDYAAKREIFERKRPFVELLVVAIADGERALKAAGKIVPKIVPNREPAPAPACSLVTSCGEGLVRDFSIDKDGTVKVFLSGKQIPDAEGKSIVLVPTVTDGAVTWSCRTDLPEKYLPDEADPGAAFYFRYWLSRMKQCLPLQ